MGNDESFFAGFGVGAVVMLIGFILLLSLVMPHHNHATEFKGACKYLGGTVASIAEDETSFCTKDGETVLTEKEFRK